MYITTLTTIDEMRHRSHIIIHDGMFYFAEFDTMDQLQFFADTLGFSLHLTEEKPWAWNKNEIYRRYEIDHKIDNNCFGGFWSIDDIPESAKPIKALSNGAIVTCYFTNDGETIKLYRPNPNAKDVYKPFPLEQHITHTKIYGLY